MTRVSAGLFPCVILFDSYKVGMDEKTKVREGSDRPNAPHLAGDQGGIRSLDCLLKPMLFTPKPHAIPFLPPHLYPCYYCCYKERRKYKSGSCRTGGWEGRPG